MVDRLSRRGFLQEYGIPAAAALIVPSFPNFDILRQAESEPRRLAREIIEFERQFGTGPVNKEVATQHAVRCAQWFAAANNTSVSWESFAARTHFISADWRPERGRTEDIWNPLQHSAVVEFRRDYPDFEFDEGLAREIIQNLRRAGNAGFNDRRYGSFVSLSQANDPSPERQNRVIVDGNNLTCEVPSPISRLRTTLLHEYQHEIVNQSSSLRRINPELTDAIFDAEKDTLNSWLHGGESLRRDRFSAESRMLSVLLGYRHLDGSTTVRWRDRFNEFMTDFLMVEQCNEYNMPYSYGSYASPVDISNFRIVQTTAALPRPQIQGISRAGEVPTFLDTFGQAAGFDAGNRHDFLKKSYSMTMGISQLPPPWQVYAMSFSGIDTRYANSYSEPATQQRAACVH